MKKKLLSLTVAATLAGVASTAQAVSMSTDGSGEVLFYPFYTVEGGNDTYVNLVNTTGNYKAVKVRFREAMNSREVLDFNLYLSPYDHWSAVVTAGANGGAVIKTADTSCTVPTSLAAPSEGVLGATVEFRSDEYSSDSIKGIERTREGYVEIIEMAEITDTRASAVNLTVNGINHVGGKPADCARVQNAWAAGGDFVNETTVAGLDVTEPTGGLYGYGVLINVAEGTDATYDAVALDDFYNPLTPAGDLHKTIGTESPGLGDALPASANFIDSAGAVQTATFTANSVAENAVDAVSAVMMHSAIMNDYVLEPNIAAGTDWVVTFPTKKEYVNGGITAPSTVHAFRNPFTVGWDTAKSQACERIDVSFWDREERQNTSEIDFSPRRDSFVSLCFEANVLTFKNSNVLSGSSRVSNNLNVDFNNGWARIGFAQAGTATGDEAREISSDGTVYDFSGLPVVGFAVQKYVNGDLNGLLSNYAGSVTHKTQTTITTAP